MITRCFESKTFRSRPGRQFFGVNSATAGFAICHAFIDRELENRSQPKTQVIDHALTTSFSGAVQDALHFLPIDFPHRPIPEVSNQMRLALLLGNGSLPVVRLPPAALLDLRDLIRTRLSVCQQGSLLKCRVKAALRRYGVRDHSDRADLFAAKRRAKLAASIARLLQETPIHEWELLTTWKAQIAVLVVCASPPSDECAC